MNVYYFSVIDHLFTNHLYIFGTLEPSPVPTLEFRTHKAPTKRAPSLPSEATRTTRAPRFNTGPPPNPCTQLMRIDAIATLRREIFVFSNLVSITEILLNTQDSPTQGLDIHVSP